MKDCSPFLAGCVTGALVTFFLYFCTCYTALQSPGSALYTQVAWNFREEEEISTAAGEADIGGVGRPPSSRVKLWTSGIMATESGAYSSVFLSPAKNFVLPVVFSSRREVSETINSISTTWGAQREGWTMAVGTAGVKTTISDQDDHILLMQSCEDFNGVELSAKQLFCLLRALHKSHHMDQYRWFLVVHRSTYVALNRLIEALVPLDSSEVFYIGRNSSHSVANMNRLGLVKHERFCKLESGIVLSREALRKIVPRLRHCLGVGISRGFTGARAGEVELGLCFSRRLGVTCSQSLDEVRIA